MKIPTSVSNLLFVVFPFIALSLFAQQSVQIEHLELPTIHPQDQIVKHLGYTLSYNEQHEQANWVAYQLTADETNNIYKRSNKFKPDPDVKTGSAENTDYVRSGYDRGHLAPAADMGWSEQAMQESFFYSNMSPQVAAFNRGIWKQLEEKVRDWAVAYRSIYVVTGPVLQNGLPYIGVNHVSVPRLYFKVILDYTTDEAKGIGFLIPNEGSKEPISHFAVSIDSVELVTHLDFFPALPDDVEAKVEKEHCFDCWK
ncbi:MAG: DNA/RNA non-specific endonuclease [Bacteroidales bacterium]|nr:DNA/RNA non-specific endonuclease [Bacteroidales bacterium]